MISVLFLLASVVLLVWAGAVAAGWASVGTILVLVLFAAACYVAAQIPWSNYTR